MAPNYPITWQEWHHDKDPVHILFKAQPHNALSKFISACKSASSRLIKKESSPIRKFLGKEYFLIEKYLSAHNRRCTDWSAQTLY